jgi:hypothetical protein
VSGESRTIPPHTCSDSDGKISGLKQCTMVRYSEIHEVIEEHPELIFSPSRLPYSDDEGEFVYYLLCFSKCAICDKQIGPLTLTGPSSGFR